MILCFILIGVIEIHVLLVGIHILQLASLTGFLQILNSNGFDGFTNLTLSISNIQKIISN